MALAASAQELTWDLSDLYRSPADPRIDQDLEASRLAAEGLAERYRGRVVALSPQNLRILLEDYESLLDRLYRPTTYASLCFAANTGDQSVQAMLARTREHATQTMTRLQFLDIELKTAPEETFAAWHTSAVLTRYRHFLGAMRRYAPHTLSEAEERIEALKSLTGVSAWVQLFDETVAQIHIPLEVDGARQELTLDEVRALRSRPERELRARATQAIHEAHRERSHVLTYVFNTVFQDHKLELELRHYGSPLAPTLLDDELSTEVVESLMATTEAHYGLAQRYYRAKARVLGLGDFATHDLLAPLESTERRVPFAEAKDLVLDSFAAFSPEFAAIARRHFESRWIDVLPRPGKRGGAFCAASLPSLHPYVLTNYNERLEDVSTVAHELGHAIHFSLASRQTLLNYGPTTPMAETASVFGEIVLMRRLIQEEKDPVARRSLLAARIEDVLATVFRQVMYTRWEQEAHARRAEGVLTADEYGALWRGQLERLYGDVVRLGALDAWGWIGIPHFIHSRFYCYSYAFGQLLVLALYRRYQEEGDRFVPRYLELLSSGGSGTPEELLGRVGIDIAQPRFWQEGFEMVEELVREFEAVT